MYCGHGRGPSDLAAHVSYSCAVRCLACLRSSHLKFFATSLFVQWQSCAVVFPFPCTTHYLGRADCISILCLRSFFDTHTLHSVPVFSRSNTPFHSLSIDWSLPLLIIEVVSQEVDRIEQQNAQLQFRLDELERDFNASGNRFPSLEKSLRRCIRVLRDMDSDMSSSSSSSSEGWLEPRPIRTHVQTLHVQIKALVRAVNRQNKRLQEFRDNLKSVQAALVKMVKKKQLGQPTGLEGYLPSKDAGEKLKASK